MAFGVYMVVFGLSVFIAGNARLGGAPFVSFLELQAILGISPRALICATFIGPGLLILSPRTWHAGLAVAIFVHLFYAISVVRSILLAPAGAPVSAVNHLFLALLAGGLFAAARQLE